MSAFWLRIVASDRMFYNEHCSYLVVPALDGEIGIMPHHKTMILAVQEGNLRLRVPEKIERHQAIMGRGILQVADNRVTMIVDTAERPEDIDEVRTRGALERAQEQLRQEQSLKKFEMSQASMVKALTRLKGSHLKGLKWWKPSK